MALRTLRPARGEVLQFPATLEHVELAEDRLRQLRFRARSSARIAVAPSARSTRSSEAEQAVPAAARRARNPAGGGRVIAPDRRGVRQGIGMNDDRSDRRSSRAAQQSREIEENQEALRRSIAETERLVSESENMLRRHRQEREQDERE
jgi:hypothetical protein